MGAEATRMTDAAFVKLIAQLSEQHGRLWVAREETADGLILVVTSRTSEPVRCLLAGKKQA